MSELPDYGEQAWRAGDVETEFVFRDCPLLFVRRLEEIFTTVIEARIEGVDYRIWIVFNWRILDRIALLAPKESADRIGLWVSTPGENILFFHEPVVLGMCCKLHPPPDGEVCGETPLPFVVHRVDRPNDAPAFGTGAARSLRQICFAAEANTVPMRWIKQNAVSGTVIDEPRLWTGGLIRVVSTGPGAVRPEIWDGTNWVPGGRLIDADRGGPVDLELLIQFGLSPDRAMRPSSIPAETTSGQDQRIECIETDDETPERYSFNHRDSSLIAAAGVLLRKVAEAETLRPAELVSVAKLQHVLSRLPRIVPDLQITLTVTGPRKKFDEIETWHYWDIEIEGERLSISSGGHFYQPSTGGDSFTTFSWTAEPGQPTDFEDYRESLWMVPDVESFPEGVASIDLASGTYKIEVIDSDDNVLLDEYEPDDDAVE